MIIVVGTPAWNPVDPAGPAGHACEIAIAAAGAGARVELVGRAGDDPVGDELVLALSRAGVGHAALLRDPARPTPRIVREPPVDGPDGASPSAAPGSEAPSSDSPRLEAADVSLGLQYLASFDVLVVSDDAPAAVIPACAEAAGFAGARLVVALSQSAEPPAALAADATVLRAPDEDGDAFPQMLGRYAAGLDRGQAAEVAFAAATSGGWERREA